MIAIVVSCERAGCGEQLGLSFDYAIESFAALLVALEADGWRALIADAVVIQTPGGETCEVAPGIQKRTHTFCPKCSAELFPGLGVYGQRVEAEALELARRAMRTGLDFAIASSGSYHDEGKPMPPKDEDR